METTHMTNSNAVTEATQAQGQHHKNGVTYATGFDFDLGKWWTRVDGGAVVHHTKPEERETYIDIETERIAKRRAAVANSIRGYRGADAVRADLDAYNARHGRKESK